jgi:hypothetical protein
MGTARAEPVLQYQFNWKNLSAITGVTWWSFYFRLFPGSIRSPRIVEFLEHLMRHVQLLSSDSAAHDLGAELICEGLEASLERV